jgi:hypothetical protein
VLGAVGGCPRCAERRDGGDRRRGPSDPPYAARARSTEHGRLHHDQKRPPARVRAEVNEMGAIKDVESVVADVFEDEAEIAKAIYEGAL